MINTILLYFVQLIHILFILFVLLVPFIGTNYLLMIHFIIVPFIMIHWLANDNTCCLTLLEKYLSKKESYECITCKIIEPIYDFKKNYSKYSTFIYGITFLIWCIGAYKLYSNYKTSNMTFNMDGIAEFMTK